MTSVPADRIVRVAGYGMSVCADGYQYRPNSVDGIREVLATARATGRKVVLRGAGRSYGDASVADEALVLDITRLNRVLDWNPHTGLIEVEAGATIETLWRTGIEDSWWPPVVSGTMYPTLAGALAMNIHGKNNSKAGTLGEHVRELDVLTTDGHLITLTPQDADFYRVISGAGLLGVITRVSLQMKRVHGGLLRVLPLAIANWDEHFEAFERYEGDADYMVSWVDCFGKGKGFGRGQFHGAWYLDEPGERPASLLPEAQDLPSTILGLVPKSMVWKFLKPINNRVGMRALNAAKYRASKILGDGKPHPQSLVGFSFLLDYVPDWRKAYLPGGFLQYQSFVPRHRAPEVFARQVEMQQEAKLESFLGVLKRHRPDQFLFSHAVNGYSLALDFKITTRNRERLFSLAHQMNEIVLEAGGRFYLAKDSTLRPTDFQRYVGAEELAEFRDARSRFDPAGILISRLAERLDI